VFAAGAIPLMALAVPPVTMIGGLGNFDVPNNTGGGCNEFEIELDGPHPEDVYHTYYNYNYHAPVITALPGNTGIRVVYTNPNHTTMPNTIEHFGVSLTYAHPITATRMRWIPGTVVAPNDPPPPPPPPPLAIPTIDTELVDTFDRPKVRETVTNTDSLGRTVWVIRRVTRATGEVPLEALMPTDPLIEGATQADAEAEEVMFGMPLVIEEDMPESNTVGSIVVSYDVYSAASATPQTRIANILTAQVMRTNMCSEAFMPQIEEEPADVIAHVDDAADFAIIASDPLDGDLTFQWRKDGVDIEGETGDSITVEPLTDESSGYYQCVVTSSCGMTLSRPAHLEVIPPCQIVVDAVDTSACAGRAAVFQIEAGGDGLTPNVYQWQIKGGTTSGSWRDIADGSDITRDGVSFTSQGANTNKLAVWVFGAASDEFRCNVTTGCGDFRSNEVNLVVSDTGDCAQCPACPADYDNNGGVDGGDLASFFTDF